jgi:hypothetical protein
LITLSLLEAVGAVLEMVFVDTVAEEQVDSAQEPV